MVERSEPARRRSIVLLFVLAPPVAAFAFVLARYAYFLSDSESGALGATALGFGGLYCVGAIVALARGVPTSKVALAGWSALLAFCLAYGARATYKALKSVRGERAAMYAALYDGADWVPAFRREQSESARSHWQPYVYWRRPPYEGESVNVDGDGVRRSWTPPGLAADAPRIFVFGGSTVWGTGARDDETIPSHLARRLHAAGASCRVTNFGEWGYVSTQGLIRLLLELRRGHVPDVVVFYDGGNDIYSAHQSSVPGIPQNESHRQREFLRGRAESPPEPPDQDPAALASGIIASYRGNVRLLTALAREYGFALHCYWQPMPHVDKPLAPEEEEIPAKRGAAFRKLIELTYAELGRQQFPPAFRSLAGVFRDDREHRYLDWCHLGSAGNAIIVDAMLPDIRASLARSR